MTELEKIEYAKSFIDKLANGINPLDDTFIPEGDIANHVRISRCFFYVSEILQKEIDRERRKHYKELKPRVVPFSLTPEQLQRFEYSADPISATTMTRRLTWLVREEIQQGHMESLSYRKITQWLINIGMIEYRDWGHGVKKRFPTTEGEEMGLVLEIWENYGRRAPVIFFSEAAQHFIIDNLDAVLATEVKKGKTSYPWGLQSTEEQDSAEANE